MIDNSVQRYAGECLRCGETLSGHAHTTGELSEPDVGDASVCTTCGELMIFTEGLRLRPATPDEVVEVESANPTVWLLRDQRGRHDWSDQPPERVVICQHCGEPCRMVIATKHNGEDSPAFIGFGPDPNGNVVHYKDRWWIRHASQLKRQDAHDAKSGTAPLARYFLHGKWTCGRGLST